MNKKIHDSFESIHLDEQSKNNILHHILHQKEEPKKNYIPLLIMALLIVFIIPTSLYFLNPQDLTESAMVGNESQEENKYTHQSQLYTLSHDITLEEMKKLHFYIIDAVHQTYNQKDMQQFLQDIKRNIPTSLIMVHFTIEGDPIFQEIQYNSQLVIIYRDASKDRFGSSHEIETYHYRHIGIYNDTLYAYNENLSQETIDNNDVYYLTHLN